MRVAKGQGSKGWLLWSGVLAVMVGAVILGTGLKASQAAASPEQVVVRKEINMQAVEPGQVPAPLYTVTFTNPDVVDIYLDAMTDTLPTGFDFIGMDPSSGWEEEPGDSIEPEIVWTGPITIEAGSTLSLTYSVYVPETVPPDTTPYVNTVEAVADDGTPIGPASAELLVTPAYSYSYLPAVFKDFSYARLTVDKSVFPTEVTTDPGEVVTYTITIRNEGDTTGTLHTVADYMPPGFIYLGMASDSDVMSDPVGETGWIGWYGSWDMPPGHEMRVIFRASASQTVGQYTNYANVAAHNANVPLTYAQATVTVEPAILLEDHFETGIDQWTKFNNYWRNEPEQWYWDANDGFQRSGAVTHNCTLGKSNPERGAHDGLIMYLGPGAEEWTDYRVETKLNLRGGMNDEGEFEEVGGYPVGLWVRGQYEDVGDADTAGWVTGYYVVIGGKPGKEMYVRLAQLQTLTDCWDQACNNPQNLYDFNNPHGLLTIKLEDLTFNRHEWYTLAVEVRGDNIKVWVNGVLAIDHTDEKEPFLTGAVGFKTYKSWTVSFDDILVTPLD